MQNLVSRRSCHAVLKPGFAAAAKPAPFGRRHKVQVLAFSESLTEGEKAIMKGMVREEMASALQPVMEQLTQLNGAVKQLGEDVEVLKVSHSKDLQTLQMANSKDLQTLQMATSKDLQMLQMATNKDLRFNLLVSLVAIPSISMGLPVVLSFLKTLS